jgi:glycosyltransferase involved in cell wall biosynthesis
VVGYLGHIDILLLYPFAKLKRKPIVFDAFFSLYDTAISDWGLSQRNSFLARFLLLLDRVACSLATLVLVDTHAQKEFFCRELRLPEGKVRWLYVGADDSVFVPVQGPSDPKPFRVLYIGNYVPLHGVPVIVGAARLLALENIEFWFIGGDSNQNDATLRLLDSKQVKCFGWMPPEELQAKVAQVDVCLGIFGTSAKAKRVIPGKAFLALAMGKPLITGDSPASRALLDDGESAILCEPGNPRALADAILRLKSDPSLKREIGSAGNRLFQTHCTPKVLGSLFSSFIREAICLQRANLERS